MHAFALTPHHLRDLLRRDANRTIQRHTAASEQRREQVALIAFDVVDEAPRIQAATSFAGEDEG